MLNWEYTSGSIDYYRAKAFGGEYVIAVLGKNDRFVEMQFKMGNSFIIPGELNYSVDRLEIAKQDAERHAASWVKTIVPDIVDAMGHLAWIEPMIDSWNYPLGMKESVGKILDQFYGVGVRPEE